MKTELEIVDQESYRDLVELATAVVKSEIKRAEENHKSLPQDVLNLYHKLQRLGVKFPVSKAIDPSLLVQQFAKELQELRKENQILKNDNHYLRQQIGQPDISDLNKTIDEFSY